jgi:hypothetical protein
MDAASQWVTRGRPSSRIEIYLQGRATLQPVTNTRLVVCSTIFGLFYPDFSIAPKGNCDQAR